MPDWYADYDSYVLNNPGSNGPTLYPGIKVGYGLFGGYANRSRDSGFFAEEQPYEESLGGFHYRGFPARSRRWGSMRPSGYSLGGGRRRRFGGYWLTNDLRRSPTAADTISSRTRRGTKLYCD